MIDFIQGKKFINLANQIYSTPHSGIEYNLYENSFNINTLNNNDIIYTNTHCVDEVIKLLEQTTKQIILITHNSDRNVIIEPSQNIIKWYSQNVNVIHDRIESIPIGLENNRWLKEIDKRGKMLSKLNENKKYKNLLYLNHNIDTNRKEREEPYRIFNNKNWVTLEQGFNGQNFNNYIDNIYNHKFILCPEGNGIDTHRTWECLYMNTIPIEKVNINNQYYTDLPICFVNEWEEITEGFLEKEYIRINSIKWDMNKLSFEYWGNKIKWMI